MERESYAGLSKSTRMHLIATRRKEIKDARKARREARKVAEEAGLGDTDPNYVPKQIPRTVESTQNRMTEKIEETDVDYIDMEEKDEFAGFFNNTVNPKILVTTTETRLTRATEKFLKEFSVVLPECYYYPREKKSLLVIREFAKEKGYTDLIIIQERNKKPFGMTISHLPKGPTMVFRLSGVVLGQDIPNSVTMTDHAPEVLTKNFDSAVGRRVQRQLRAMFPQTEEFGGRRVCIFQNQRDFVFFRHYRYVFVKEGEKVQLGEIGPRFTLKLRSIKTDQTELTDELFEFYWTTKVNATARDAFM